MQETYTLKRLFIATPCDLYSERNSLVNVVTEINKIKAHPVGYHLEVMGWESTLPGNGRPQELINKEIEKCDLFIMVLWQHWGMPTGKYSSGTEEEYYVALDLYDKSQNPEMWLFFKTPDELLEEENPIMQFRSKIEAERKLFYKEFVNLTDWENKLRACLCGWLDTFADRNFENTELVRVSKISPIANRILYTISYQDWIGSFLTLDPIIYITIQDEESFGIWKNLTQQEQKQFLYDRHSENLGLVLGANPYLGTIRYHAPNGQYILLGTITRKYEESLDESHIFIANDFGHLCEKSNFEISFDGHNKINLHENEIQH